MPAKSWPWWRTSCYNSLMSPATINTEADILFRVIVPDKPSLSEEAARSILALGFSRLDRDRMEKLAEKAREGALTEVVDVHEGPG